MYYAIISAIMIINLKVSIYSVLLMAMRVDTADKNVSMYTRLMISNPHTCMSKIRHRPSVNRRNIDLISAGCMTVYSIN